MATLLSRDPALRGQISFHSYSRFATRDDENRARDLARSLGLEDSVEFLPLIPRVQFMEKAASEATHLALITHQSESDYAIPGKIFDYITLGKPTFAVTSDTNLRNFLAHHEIPSYVSRHDPDSIAEALARLCRDWRGPATQAQDRTTALSGTEMARKILELN